MTLRYCAEFETSLPEVGGDPLDEGVEPCGGNVAIAIHGLLCRLGCDADPPENAGEHGWEFVVRVKGYPKGCRLLCTVTLIHAYDLTLANTSWWDRVRKKHPAPYVATLRALARELAADPRFMDVRWYDPLGGPAEPIRAPHPVDEA